MVARTFNESVVKAQSESFRPELGQLNNRLQAENIRLCEEILSDHNLGGIIGKSESLKACLCQAAQVAPTSSTVLILGETGTGKELLAREIHRLSLRKARPMVKVNCASLPANLIESELFGHERGAFTGASAARLGRFEIANGATIFLDEICELPLDLQTKLLRVLQEGEFERLGSSRTIKVDVRVIAASNQGLKLAVKQDSFRADLYYRLSVFPISLPPLRERVEDIPLLVSHFIGQMNCKLRKKIETISQETIETLQRYHWPGNLRELQNVIERACIITQGSRLQLRDNLDVHRCPQNDESKIKPPQTTDIKPVVVGTLNEVEKDYMIRILEKTYWRVEGKSGAAEILGINPHTLRSRMRKYGIRRPMVELKAAG